MKVTRILQANLPNELGPICKTMGFVRADLWRRYGALQNVGKSNQTIRAEIAAAGYYKDLPVDGTIRNETTKNIIDDVLMFKAAAMVKVRRAIHVRTPDKAEQKRLYTLLREDQWQTDNFLHRQMRKHFRHGRSSVTNQFIVRSDKHASQVIEGQLNVTIRIAKKYGDPVTLATTSSGKHVDLTGKNLRILVKDGHTEIHYATEKGKGRPCGTRIIGIDKGYSEAFTDSDGQAHGEAFLVNAAYTSQMDSTTGWLQGKRVGDKFYRENGDVLQADHNAALNVLARLDDREIARFTPYQAVRKILLARYPAQLSVKRLEPANLSGQVQINPNRQLCLIF